MNILVAYATRHGATRGIAERIAQTLRAKGMEVSLQPAQNVTDVKGYDAFVIGSSAYAFHWLKEAVSLVRRHSALLASRPVWLFSSGPLGTDKFDEKGREQTEAARPAEFAEFERTIKPRGTQVFYGAYDPDEPPSGLAERFMKGFMHVVPSLRNALPIGDFRDWPLIERWAEGIAAELAAKETVRDERVPAHVG